MVSVWVVPRPPQPSSPTRTAELACAPRTVCGFRSVKAAVPAAPVRNVRRPIFSLFIAFSPSANQFLQVFLGGQNVLGLLRALNLALNRQRVLIANLLQVRDDHLEIHLALPDRNLAA